MNDDRDQNPIKKPRRRKRRRGGRKHRKGGHVITDHAPAETVSTYPEPGEVVPVKLNSVTVELQDRHFAIFDWLARSLGKTPEQLAQEMMRQAIMRNKPAFMEARGAVSMSMRTKDLSKIVPPEAVPLARGEQK